MTKQINRTGLTAIRCLPLASPPQSRSLNWTWKGCCSRHTKSVQVVGWPLPTLHVMWLDLKRIHFSQRIQFTPLLPAHHTVDIHSRPAWLLANGRASFRSSTSNIVIRSTSAGSPGQDEHLGSQADHVAGQLPIYPFIPPSLPWNVWNVSMFVPRIGLVLHTSSHARTHLAT